MADVNASDPVSSLRRLSLILQFASSKSQKPSRRPTTAPGRNGRKRHRKEYGAGVGSVFSTESDTDGPHYRHPAASSSLSVSDTLLTSSRSPSFPWSPGSLTSPSTPFSDHLTQSPSTLPPSLPEIPTSDDISEDLDDAAERIRMLKKIRKLSRVLGELPSMVLSIDDKPPLPSTVIHFDGPAGLKDAMGSPSSNASSIPSPLPDFPLVSKRKSIQRSIAVGYSNSQGLQEPHLQRSRSHGSLQPNLTPSIASISKCDVSTYSLSTPPTPITFSWPSIADPPTKNDENTTSPPLNNSDPLSSTELRSLAGGETSTNILPPPARLGDGVDGLSPSIGVSRQDSASAVVSEPFCGPTSLRHTNQEQHDRPAKLERVGEHVPQDILLHPSPSPPSSRLQSPTDSVMQMPSSLLPSPPLTASPTHTSTPHSLPGLLVPPPIPLEEPSVIPPPTPIMLLNRDLPARSSSLKRRKGDTPTRRRLSLDLRLLTATTTVPAAASTGTELPLTPQSPANLSGTTKSAKRLKKSRSWVKKVFVENEDIHVERVRKSSESFHSEDVTRRVMSDKQRLLNVRRARKMAKVFGDEPPTALFQITHVSSTSLSSDGEEDEDGRSPHRRRNSLATIISISSSISPSLNHVASEPQKGRDSYMSMSSVMTSSSEIAMKAPSSPPVVDESQAPQASEASTLVRPSTVESSQPTIGHLNKRTSKRTPPSHIPIPSSSELGVVTPSFPMTPKTPPPFSDLLMPQSAPPVPPVSSAPPAVAAPSAKKTSEDGDSTPAEFQVRRRQAAKLSRFFGVEANQLADILPSRPSMSRAPSTHASANAAPRKSHSSDRSVRVEADVPALPPRPKTTAPPEIAPRGTTSVEVTSSKGSGPLRFLSQGDTMKQVDIYDAIDQLRRMKSM